MEENTVRRGMYLIREESQWTLLGARNVEFSLEKVAFEAGYRVDIVSDRVGCSSRQFQKIFLRDIGIPPKRWLREERMAVALRMLYARRRPPEVTRLLGFATGSNFAREFIATYRISPADFEDFMYKRGKYLGGDESMELVEALARRVNVDFHR